MSAARLRDPAGVAGARPLEDGGRGPADQSEVSTGVT